MTTSSAGYQRPADDNNDVNAVDFQVRQLIGQIGTMLPVRVLMVNPPINGAAVGSVDVQPLVDQHDGAGNSVPHGPLHNLPYHRVQGGDCAVIIDPVAGDTGLAFFAQRDISAVKARGGDQNVRGSNRRHDMADGVYHGGILNGAPKHVITISNAAGISLNSTLPIALVCPKLTHNGVDIGSDHTHTGVKAGTDDTGPPVSTP